MNTKNLTPQVLMLIAGLRRQSRVFKITTFVLIIVLFSVLGYKFSSKSSTDEEAIKKEDIESKDNFIAEIYVDGVIESDKYRDKVLDKILESKNIKALIVNINSPGGTITGSEILYLKLSEIAKKIPVVSVIYDLGASGGYMASLASEYIIVHATSITGSIGVLMRSYDVSEVSKKIGFTVRTYKSSEFKAAPDPFNKPSEKVNRYLENSINEGYLFFRNLVKERREMSESKLNSIADGRIFSGYIAVKEGLADEVGTRKTAISYLFDEYNLKDLKTYEILIKEEEDMGFFGQSLKGTLASIKRASLSRSQQQVYAIMQE